MARDTHIGPGWPVFLVLGTMMGLIGTLSPAGREIVSQVLATCHGAFATSEPAGPARPQVLMFTRSPEDQFTARMAVNPRGYRVLVAETAAAARNVLEADPTGIGVVMIDMKMEKAAQVVGLARSLAPSAKLIRLQPNHRARDISVSLMNVI